MNNEETSPFLKKIILQKFISCLNKYNVNIGHNALEYEYNISLKVFYNFLGVKPVGTLTFLGGD
jgi:hypothetical protein